MRHNTDLPQDGIVIQVISAASPPLECFFPDLQRLTPLRNVVPFVPSQLNKAVSLKENNLARTSECQTSGVLL